MFNAKLVVLAIAGSLLTSAASAMPLSNLSESIQGDQAIQQVRLVCNDRGQCWRTPSRRYVRPHYRSSYYGSGPSYGYGQPSYGYGQPSYRYGQPGVGINLRF
jgi:hypothetical protein